MDIHKRNSLFQHFSVYTIVFTFFSVVYVCSFHSQLFSGQDVLFYRGIFLLAATFAISITVSAFVYRFFQFSLESFLAALIASAAIHLSLFVVFPVTFDRSVTMFLLTRMNSAQPTDSCPGYSMPELERRFIDEYIVRNAAIERRMHEQSLIRTVEKSGQCVSLTSEGKNFLSFSRFVSRMYNVTIR